MERTGFKWFKPTSTGRSKRERRRYNRRDKEKKTRGSLAKPHQGMISGTRGKGREEKGGRSHGEIHKQHGGKREN